MVNLNDLLDPEKSIPENFSFNNTQENGFTIADEQGNISFKIDEEGNTKFNIDNQFAAKLKTLIYPPDSGLADINHIITYGQSLAEGSNSLPIQTPTSFSSSAKMFNHGIKTRYASQNKYQFLDNHREWQNGENGETPAAGTADMFLREFDKKSLKNKWILSSCCARGGMSISALSKGTEYYNYILEDVRNGMRLAVEQRKSYRVMAITWTQGEYNYGTGINKYKKALKQLRTDLIQDIEAITGDDYSDLPFIMYQVSSSYSTKNSEGYPDVALAKLELALEKGSGFYLATPIYQLRYHDEWHLLGPSSKLLGAYYGYVLSKVISGEDWQPLHPISHTINGKFLNLKFNKSGLTFDKPEYFKEKNLTIPNRGFSIKNSLKQEIITKVERLSDDNNCDTLRIECKESPKNLIITYGFFDIANRNAGELHDNNNIVYRIGDKDYHLYNWCVIFSYHLSEQQS